MKINRLIVAILLAGVALVGAGCIIPHAHHGGYGHMAAGIIVTIMGTMDMMDTVTDCTPILAKYHRAGAKECCASPLRMRIVHLSLKTFGGCRCLIGGCLL